MNLVNKKLASDLAASVETSLNEFIEIEVNKRVEAITKSNEIWGNFSRWFDEHLEAEIKEAVRLENNFKEKGLSLSKLETEGLRRGLITLRNDFEQWKEWEGIV
jgi:hypothetical protein